MHPVLFKFGNFQIHPYGLCLAISFLVGILWAARRAEKRGIRKDSVLDLAMIIIVCAIAGSRLFYVITHVEEFRGHWTDTFNPFQSSGEVGLAGLSMLGGVVLSLAAIVLFCRIKKIPLLGFCDSAAPSFAFGLALTRIGCFLNGCCFGKPCSLPWGVVFPLNSPAGSTLPEMRLHPTQLYSSLFDWILLAVLLLLDRKKRFNGFLTSIFFMGYGLFRFSIDFVRYYESSVQIHIAGAAITFNQIISMSMALFGVALMLALRKKPRNN
jgi:phosphatidylglycerol---prolipoprotein diacylglyceryl transferase